MRSLPVFGGWVSITRGSQFIPTFGESLIQKRHTMVFLTFKTKPFFMPIREKSAQHPRRWSSSGRLAEQLGLPRWVQLLSQAISRHFTLRYRLRYGICCLQAY